MKYTTEKLLQIGIEKSKNDFYEEEIKVYNQLIQIDPTNAIAYFKRGVARYELREYEAAISDYSQVILIDPNDATAYYNRGLIKAELRDYETAISDFDKFIQIDANDATAYLHRGQAKDNAGDHLGAITDFNEALQIDPDLAIAYSLIGSVKFTLEDNQGAIDNFDQALKFNPDDPLTYSNRGNANLALGNRKSAIFDYEQAIKIDPNFAAAYFNLGIVFLGYNEHQTTIDNFSKSIYLAPKYAAAYANRGAAYYNFENDIAAIADCTEALQIDKYNVFAYCIRGLCYQSTDLYLSQLDFNRFYYLTDDVLFFKNLKYVFHYHQEFTAPYLLYRTLEKFTDNFEQFNTIHPIVDATRQQCRPWKIWEEYHQLAGSKKQEPLAHYHALALVNHYMGDPIKAFQIYDEVLDDEKAMGVPLNLMGLYYYIESAKLFREEHEVILEDAIEQIQESQSDLIEKNAFRELYYAGQILWANDQLVEAHEFFELADDYLPAAYMQVLTLPMMGASEDDIQSKIHEIRKREAELSLNEGFLQGFPTRPFRLEKQDEDFLAPILHYAHYREIAEAITEVRDPSQHFEHQEMWKAFYWLPEDEKEIEWLLRRERLAEINKALLEKFRANITTRFDGKENAEMVLIEQAFGDIIKRENWENSKYIDFEDFKAKTNAISNLAQQLSRLISDNYRLSAHNKMLLVEYCYLRGDLLIEDVFLMYFYIDKHRSATVHGNNVMQEGLVDTSKKIMELLLSPITITGQVLTAAAAAALTELLGKFSTQSNVAPDINLEKYRQAAAGNLPAESSDYDRFVDDFLRYLSYKQETLGKEKFAQRYPLGGFEDWWKKQ